MIAVLNIIATAAAPMPMPMPPAITPQSITFPIVDAKCSIKDTRGRAFDLALRQSGGRGYPLKGSNGSAERGRTDLKTEVLEDSTGRFRNLEFETWPNATWPGNVKAFVGGHTDIQFQTLETDDRDTFVLLIRTNWPAAAVSFVGLCNVEKTPQVALTGPEADKAANK